MVPTANNLDVLLNAVVLKIAARSERVKRTKVAIVHYGTYIHCAGVHVYREDAKKSKELLLNKVNMARRIMMYRATLEAGIHRKERRYVAPLISQPQQLNPWEWQEWLTMLRSGANIDALLERFGLVRMTSLDAKELAIANAMASKVTVNPEINIQCPTINNTQTASPNISFSPSTTMSPNHILHGGHGMHAEAPTPSSQMHTMGSAAGMLLQCPLLTVSITSILPTLHRPLLPSLLPRPATLFLVIRCRNLTPPQHLLRKRLRNRTDRDAFPTSFLSCDHSKACRLS